MIKYYPSKKHVSYLIITACVIFSGLSGAATQKRWMPYISWLRPKDALRITAQGWVSKYKMQHFAVISREWEGHEPRVPKPMPKQPLPRVPKPAKPKPELDPNDLITYEEVMQMLNKLTQQEQK